MKIAVASEGNIVSGHFGHCSNFNIYNVEDKKILNNELVDNPGHKTGFLPKFLNDMEIDIIITGGMGEKAIELFNENNIEVIIGAEGNVSEIVERYINGDLVSTEYVCDKHEHAGDCGNH